MTLEQAVKERNKVDKTLLSTWNSNKEDTPYIPSSDLESLDIYSDSLYFKVNRVIRKKEKQNKNFVDTKLNESLKKAYQHCLTGVKSDNGDLPFNLNNLDSYDIEYCIKIVDNPSLLLNKDI